jgi:hypothetical protein
MVSYWAQFAKTGTPGRGTGGDRPDWTAWDDSSPGAPPYLVLAIEDRGGVRMSSQPETRVLSDVDGDPRLSKQRECCRVFRELAGFGNGLSREQYPTAGAKGCTGFWPTTSSYDEVPR